MTTENTIEILSEDDPVLARWGLTREEKQRILQGGESHIERINQSFSFLNGQGFSRSAEKTDGEAVQKISISNDEREDAVRDRERDWKKLFSDSCMTLDGVEALRLPERKALCGDWFYEAGIGFVFAPRGVGKTWFSLWLALCLSKGHEFAKWQCPKPVNTLYIDGEMPVGQMMDRIKSMGGDIPKTFKIISHEVLWHNGEAVLNLTSPDHQDAITQVCIEQNIKVLFLDNLSALMSGIEENNNDDWAIRVLPWILGLRRRGIALVIVHHAGRNGKMRGASRKEDHPDWIIQLSESQSDETGRFLSSFSKPPRGAREACPAFDWHFKTLETGEVLPIIRNASLQDRIMSLIEDGLDSCSDIANELGVTKAQVSKTAKRLKADGRIEIEGRSYRIRQ